MEQYKTIQNAQTIIGDGDYIITNTIDTLVLSISGTSTSFTINFTASLDGVNYGLFEGNKLGNSSILANTTSTIGELWEFDVSGVNYFKAKLTAIANGNITAIGNGLNS